MRKGLLWPPSDILFFQLFVLVLVNCWDKKSNSQSEGPDFTGNRNQQCYLLGYCPLTILLWIWRWYAMPATCIRDHIVILNSVIFLLSAQYVLCQGYIYFFLIQSFFLLNRLPTTAREPSLLNQSSGGKEGIHMFPKRICAKMNIINSTGIWIWLASSHSETLHIYKKDVGVLHYGIFVLPCNSAFNSWFIQSISFPPTPNIIYVDTPVWVDVSVNLHLLACAFERLTINCVVIVRFSSLKSLSKTSSQLIWWV